MRYRELLTETGLSPNEVFKHDYLDILRDKIKNGEEIIVEPEYSAKFGETVVIDASQLKVLNKWVKEFEDGTTKAAPQLKIAGGTRTILLSYLSKSSLRGGLNAGILSEGALGAALTAKFVNQDRPVYESDVIQVLTKIGNVRSVGNSLQGTYTGKTRSTTKSQSDTIKFEFRLAAAEFKYLTSGLASINASLKKVINGAVMFVNASNYSIPSAISKVNAQFGVNQIEVITNGIGDNCGTKADLIVKINGSAIDLISLKASGVRQFGQASGGTAFPDLIKDFFNVPVNAKGLKELSKADSKDKVKILDNVARNFDRICQIYEEITPKITKEFKKTDKEATAVIKQIAAGVAKHAAKNDPLLTMVKLHDTGGGGYTVMRPNAESFKKLRQLNFSVVYNGSGTLQINAQPKKEGTDLADQVKSWPALLFQIRTSLAQSGSYIRNRVEMGPVLEAVMLVKKESASKLNPDEIAAAKAPPKKLKARFEPAPSAGNRKTR